MLRRVQVFLVSAVWVAASGAAAQDFGEDPASGGDASSATDELRAELDALRAEVEALKEQQATEAKADAEGAEDAEDDKAESTATDGEKGLKLGGKIAGWETGIKGYFRAPLIMSISNRPSPDDMGGAAETQLSYGPNRVVDSNYYSFAYTRLQELDWAELSFYVRREHVDAEVGWMGYWYQAAGFRNPDAGWAPAIARLTLDWDLVDKNNVVLNAALSGGAWWPKFGYHQKYDTYTLGQFRQLGEQTKWELRIGSDYKVTFYQGFGSSRDGNYNFSTGNAPKIYGATTSLNLLHYEHLRFAFRDYVDVGIHYSNQFTRDPNLYRQDSGSYVYSAAKEAKLSVVGGEISVSAPRAGRLWVSPSYITVKNGWALAEGGTEVMHSLGGAGIAGNYMGWSTSLDNSTGTGNMFNLGFLYENSLSTILGKDRGSMLPDVTASVFGLMAIANLDLPAGSTVSQDQIKQFKWGVDAELHAREWLGFMVRYDSVNYDLNHGGYIFSAATARLTFSSHFLSGERIYIQYSHYFYGDNMTIAGKWPWNQTLVAGSEYTQGSPAYLGWEPDRDVLKIQAEISF